MHILIYGFMTHIKHLFCMCTVLAGIAQAEPLSPARALVGTWKTPLPVTFHIKTDYWGSMQKMALNKRVVTWVITRGPNASTVNIAQTFRSKSFKVVYPYSDITGYTPDVTTNFYTGKIDGTRLYIMSGSRRVGKINFTTHLMKGDWNDDWTMIYRQRVHTINQELQLTKQ